MPNLRDLEVGLMFWGERNPERTLRQVQALGFRCGHLGFAGQVPLGADDVRAWRAALDASSFVVTAVFAAFNGESYADIPTVQRTVGFVPVATRAEREVRARQVIDAGAQLGVGLFACHIGFVPHDPAHPDHVALRDLVGRLCDHAATHGVTFALETGQEPPDAMMAFLQEVGRDNLKLNFDPANLILYGTAEPIAALDVMGPAVASVHVKDGLWPPPDQPEALGTEMPLGQGAVGLDRYVAKLKQIGYRGPLVIEREVALDQDMDDRHGEGVAHQEDIREAIGLLERLRA